MRGVYSILAIFALVAVMAVPAAANPVNLALDGMTGYFGTFGVGGWGSGILATSATAVDGLFLAEGTQWDQHTSWWDENNPQSMGATVSVYFKTAGVVEHFVVQADNNDDYLISGYFNHQLVGTYVIPAVNGWGMMTRQYNLATPVTLTDLEFTHLNGGGGG